ncbi:MAG: conjugal transfer protein TrbN, partial [Gammaproteobacteria bacterium]|nr:conjugal transfer protein TrbN [Gammaproteobacteria bacterium]
MLDLPAPDVYPYGPATLECVLQAAAQQAVPSNVLLAIASQEAGTNGQVVANANGSFDLSHFQINTDTWRRELAPYGVGLADLRWRGCYNAMLAAFILHKRLQEPDVDFWRKAANYHSRTPQFNLRYRIRLMLLSVEWARWLQYTYSTV